MQDYSKPYHDFAAEKLGADFANIDLLMVAFTHRSYLNEHKKTGTEHNERLEFLGDAVLELVVTEYLYSNYTEPEGVLTNWRSSLVRTESISAAASRTGFGPLLRLSRGERRGTDRARMQILANTFEAVTGALYLDQGYDAAKQFIYQSLLPTFDNILQTGSWLDAKSQLQELSQNHESMTPIYKVIDEVGPDHEKIFTIGVYIGSELRGTGTGLSKQAGQQQAAEQALGRYQKTNPVTAVASTTQQL
jgi:ribonuclease-3